MNTASLAQRLAGIKVVSFDLDDTLWELAPVIAAAEEQCYRWLQQQVPELTRQYSLPAIREHRLLFAQRYPELRTDVTQLRKRSLRELVAQAGRATSNNYNVDQVVEDAFGIFYRERSRVTLYPDVIETLTWLRQRYSLAAVTNGNADLELAGVAAFFDHAHQATLDNAPKPAPDMFWHCARNAGVSPHEILHVGDHVDADVQGAIGAGCMSVWFNPQGLGWPTDLPRPDMQIQALEQLVGVLGAA